MKIKSILLYYIFSALRFMLNENGELLLDPTSTKHNITVDDPELLAKDRVLVNESDSYRSSRSKRAKTERWFQEETTKFFNVFFSSLLLLVLKHVWDRFYYDRSLKNAPRKRQKAN